MTVPTAATFHHNIFNSARGCAFNRNDFTVSDSAKPPVKSGDDVQRAIFIAKRFGTTLVLAAVLGPDCPPWLSCREKEWVRRLGASPPMRMSASWFGSSTQPDTRSWRDYPRPESGLPSDRHPDRTKRAVVLEAVKVWPGKTRACRKVGATANLDSSCARRGLQAEQRNRSRKMRRSKTA
jgi:hypothetical protein